MYKHTHTHTHTHTHSMHARMHLINARYQGLLPTSDRYTYTSKCTAVLKLRLAISMALDRGPVGWFSTAACGRCEETEDKDEAWKWSSVRVSESERARKSVRGRGVGGGATGRPNRYQASTLFCTLFTRSCRHVTQRLPTAGVIFQ
jgi:hypothetical protein